MKKINKFLKLTKYLLVSTVALTPLIFLTSCSSEPSFKTYEYSIKVGNLNIQDIKSQSITTKVAQAVRIATNALYLNYSYEWKNLLLESSNQEFEYLYTGSWSSGSGPFAGTKTGFGIKSITINSSTEWSVLNHQQASGTESTFQVSAVQMKYGFYDGDTGDSLSDLNDIQNRLKSKVDFNTNYLPSKTEYTIDFNIQMNIQLKRDKDDNDTDWQIGDSSTLTVGTKTIEGDSKIDQYVSEMSSIPNRTAKDEKVTKEDIEYYEGLIKSIS